MIFQIFNGLCERVLTGVEGIYAIQESACVGWAFEQINGFLPGVEFVFRHDDDRPQAFIDNTDGFPVVQDGSKCLGNGLPCSSA